MNKVILVAFICIGVFFILSLLLWPSDSGDKDSFTDLSTLPDTNVSQTQQDGGSKIVMQTENGPVHINDVRIQENTRKLDAERFELRADPAEEFFPDFNIVYSEETSSFSISINALPLHDTRIAAESFLQASLGISTVEMCALKVYLGVPFDVDPILSGQNLGFSFCPDSVSLE